MAYIHIPEESGSWYAPEEGQAWARRPVEPGRTAGWGSYSFAAPTGWGLGSYLGQPPATTQQCPSTYLGAGPTAVLERFDFDVPKPGWLLGSALKPFHRLSCKASLSKWRRAGIPSSLFASFAWLVIPIQLEAATTTITWAGDARSKCKTPSRRPSKRSSRGSVDRSPLSQTQRVSGALWTTTANPRGVHEIVAWRCSYGPCKPLHLPRRRHRLRRRR